MSQDDGFARLLEDARSGSPPAFAALVAPHRSRLLAFLRMRTPDRLRHLVDPEDLLQELMMHAFRGLTTVELEGDPALRAWLFRIARNAINECGRRHLATAMRDEGRVVPLPTSARGSAFAGAATGAVTRLQREERLQRLESALRELTIEHREVIVLSRIEGLPLSEVARRMDRSIVAVSALLLRALRKLRQAFGETESLSLPLRGIAVRPGTHGAEEDG